MLEAGLTSYVLFSPQREATGPQIAAVFAVLLLPYSLVGPFAGVLIDRWRRRQILVYANVLRAGLALVLAAFAASSVENAWFGVVALVALGVNRFYLAALSAALPHVVAPGRLVTANAVATTAGTVATAVGAGLALGARAAFGNTDRVAALSVLVVSAGYLVAGFIG